MTSDLAPALLLLDAGTTTEKLSLAVQVEGEARLAAQVTRPAAGSSSASGTFADLLNRLEDLTGWRLAAQDGRLDRSLVSLAVSTSAPPLLKMLVMAGTKSAAQKLAEGLSTMGFNEVAGQAVIGPPEGDNNAVSLERAMRCLDGAEVGALAVSASSPAEAMTIGRLIGAADVASRLPRLPVLFAGPDEVGAALRESLPAAVEFRHVNQAAWFGPGFDTGLALAGLSADYMTPENRPVLQRDPFEQAASLAADLDALSLVAQLLARARQSEVTILDPGGRTTSIIAAAPRDLPDGPRGPDIERYLSSVPIGTTGDVEPLLEQVSLEWLQGWLPFDLDTDELADYLANRRARGDFVPQDQKQALLEHAVIRAISKCARSGLSRANAAELLIASGALAQGPLLGQIALVLLDVFEPLAPCRLLADRADLLPRLGAAALLDPAAAVSLLQQDALVDIGLCLSLPYAREEAGDLLAEISPEITDGIARASPELREHYEIRSGTLTVVPIPPGIDTVVRVVEHRRHDLGLGKSRLVHLRAGDDRGSSAKEYQVEGGVLGLIVDARGRPLPEDEERSVRQARLIDALQALGAAGAESVSRL
ncbi:MAG TPA: glutamate mutase L [Chloroflexota bacterium]|nr:glutamate mutase L [Chloroflexota bacterium]